MIAKFSDPIAAAKNVVAEAYRLWLTFDERTDDITIIIIYFDDIKISPTSGSNSAVDSLSPSRVVKVTPDNVSSIRGADMLLSSDQMESRPVRTVLSKARRKEISELLVDDHEEFDFSSVVDTKVRKSDEQNI